MKHPQLTRFLGLLTLVASGIAQPCGSGEGLTRMNLSFASYRGEAWLIGFDEYTAPSTPRRKYRTKTAMGSTDYDLFWSADQTCQNLRWSKTITFSGTITYDKSTGAVTGGIDGFIDDNACVRVALTPTTRINSLAGGCSTCWHIPYDQKAKATSKMEFLLDEDTENDAEQRALAQAQAGTGNVAYRTGRGTGFAFSFQRVRYSAAFLVTCPGDYDVTVRYALKPHLAAGPVTYEALVQRCHFEAGLQVWEDTFVPRETDVDYTIVDVAAHSPCTGTAGSFATVLGSVKLAFNLGTDAAGLPAGSLRLESETLTGSVYSPAGLIPALMAGGSAEVVRGADRVLRQVKAPQALVDVAVLNPAAYELRFYPAAQVGTRDSVTGTYAPTGSPVVVHRIENPDMAEGLLVRLRVSEIRGATTRVTEYSRDPATESWALSTGDGSRREEETTSQVNGDRVVMRVVRGADGSIVSQTARTYHSFPWGEELVREVADPAGAAMKTDYLYHEAVPASDPNYRRLRQRIDALGTWERFSYDARGRTIRRVEPFLGAGPETADEALCRVTEWVYDILPDADGDGVPEALVATIRRTLGQETSRSYRIDWSRQVTLGADACRRRTESVCTVAGSGWDSPDNLATETLTYASGAFTGRERRIRRPDGTVVLTSYARAPDGSLAVVEQRGAPTAAGDAIVDGHSTTTVLSPVGQAISCRLLDVASGLMLDGWTATVWDAWRRPTRLDYIDGTYVVRTFDCCGLVSERDRNGRVTQWTRDALGRSVSVMQNGIGLRTAWDAAGRPIARVRVGTDGSEMVQETNRYDVAGRLRERRDALGRLTTISEAFDPWSGQNGRTTTAPDGATTIETWARDGTLVSRTGTAVVPRVFTHGVDAEGVFVQETAVLSDGAGQADLAEWTRSYRDFAGRAHLTVHPDGAKTRTYFNRIGQAVRTVDPDGVVHLFAYNPRGECEVMAVDINRNGEIDFSGPDRIWRIRRRVEAKQGPGGTEVVERTTIEAWELESSGQPNVVLREERAAGGSGLRTEERGLVTEITVVRDGAGGWTETIVDPAGLKTVRTHAGGLLRNERVVAGTEQLVRREYAYDSHGRLTGVAETPGGSTSVTYRADDRVLAVTLPDPDPARTGPGYDPESIAYQYDEMGRVAGVIHSGAGEVRLTYWPTGWLRRVWGAQTVPVEYAYDSQGRLRSLTTWQDFAADRGRALTTWNYDRLRGWLLSLRHADGAGADYRYTPAGRLRERVGGRAGATAVYGYGPAGDLVRIGYADATPAVDYELGRDGRLLGIRDDSGAKRLAYGSTGAVESETYTAGPLAGFAVTRGHDNGGRQSQLEVRSPQGSGILRANYVHDGASRLTELASGEVAASYAFAPGLSRVSGVTLRQGGVVRLNSQVTYDLLGRVSRVVSSGVVVLAEHVHAWDGAGLRARVAREDKSVWELRHDALGQLVGATRRLADGLPVPGSEWSWTFDDIGNRRSQRRNGALTEYASTLLNQYSQRSVPGVVEVLGWASPAATVSVTVDEGIPQRATRQAELFWHLARVDNSVAAQHPRITVTGVANGVGPAQEDAVTEVPRWAHVPRSPEILVHDADGNRIEDASWRYSWDAENRLVAMETAPAAADAGVPRRRLEFGYDAMGRRVSKRVYSAGSAGWALTAHTRFLHDGWNLVAELDALADHAVKRTQIWGNDLSGSPRGAAGVGGLVAVRDSDGPARLVAADGDGHVVAAVRADDGGIAARYDYTPWGELLRLEGPWAAQNPWRFSSRYTDVETGLVHFGLRYLDPAEGRWLNRDPYGEAGGANLYAFVQNSPHRWTDPLGLALYAFDGTNNDGERDVRDGAETNVFALAKAYTGNVAYSPGVGTHDGLLNPLGLAFGVGGLARIDAMLSKAAEFVDRGDRVADIVGFSRGAAQARAFAHRLRERYPCVTIRWMGLFDTVASTGLPNDINPGYRLGLPAQVGRVLHLTAGGERRRLTFALTSIKPSPGEPNPNPNYREVEIPGAAHSDVGGGYGGERGLANLALLLMWQDGRDQEVPLAPLASRYANYVGSPHDSRWITDKFIELVTGTPRQRKVYYHP
jgi:RHS repeat-associated protein